LNDEKTIIILIISISLGSVLFGQENEDKNPVHLSGSAGLTNNGISLIPNFSLGDPAALFNLSVSKGRLSFVTDFNFSLEAKPWYTLYWLKYQLVEREKFKITSGTHLGLNFFSSEVEINSIVTEKLHYERYWVADIFPRYFVNENASFGIYYLQSRGIDEGTVGVSHFLTLNANFSRINLSRKLFLGINPQLYYLNQDGTDGFYFTSAFTFGISTFPVTLNAMINQPINTDIVAGNEFVWNFSLIYSFKK
jgi:hypothetical protein